MQALIQKLDMQYEFELCEEDKSRLFTRLMSVCRGDSIDTVRQTLGFPGNERPNFRKGSGLESYSLEYDVKRISLTGRNNKHDQEISLYFYLDRKLTKIGFSGIEPFVGEIIPGIGWPEMKVFFTSPPPRGDELRATHQTPAQ